MNKILVFDMDGTIVDFYGVEGWLDYLINENTTPYDIAKPIYEMTMIKTLLEILKDLGWQVVITSWLSKNGTESYNRKVTESKKKWLDRFNFPYDVLNIVEYGTEKSSCTTNFGGYQILFDDEKQNIESWKNGKAIDVTKENIFDVLVELIIKENV